MAELAKRLQPVPVWTPNWFVADIKTGVRGVRHHVMHDPAARSLLCASVMPRAMQALTLQFEDQTCFSVDQYSSELDLFPPDAYTDDTKSRLALLCCRRPFCAKELTAHVFLS